MSSVDFPLRRDDLTDFISRSSSTSSAKASFDESADEELIELVLTIANPFKNWKFIRLNVSSTYLQVNLCQKLLFLQSMGRTSWVQKLF